MQSTQKMSARSSQDLPRRTCTRLCKDMWQDFIRMFTTSSHKDLYTRPRSRSSSITGASKMKLLQDRQTLASGRTKSGTLVLCEPAQSKGTWRCHKSHFTSARRVCASLRSRNAHGYVTRAVLCENLQITRKMPGTKSATHSLCEPAQSKCTRTSHKSHLIWRENLQKWCHRPKTRRRLCASLFCQAQASWTTRQQCSSELSHFQEIQVDPNHSDSKPRATMSSQWWRYLASQSRKGSCGNLVYRVVHFFVGGRMSIVELKIAMIGFRHRYFRSICASLRNRHAHGHVARENLQEKCRKPDGAPWSGTDLNSYRKNASVWTHCFGNDCHGW